MAYLTEYIINWYFTPLSKVSPNTFITTRKQEIRSGAGTKGARIGDIPAGVLIVIDQEEWDRDQGWARIYYIPYKNGTNVPAGWEDDLLMLKFADGTPVNGYIPESWKEALVKLGFPDTLGQAWIDQSAFVTWTDTPVVPEPEPEPEEPTPCPEPVPCPELPKPDYTVKLFGYEITFRKL